MKGFWNELQRRQIIKSAVAYLVVSWLIIQVVSILFPIFSFSPGSQKMVVIVLAILFPAWLIFNWIYEPSTKGLVKTNDTPDDSEGIKKKRISLNRVITVGLGLVVVLLVINTVRLQSKIIRDEDGKSSIAVLYFDNMSADDDNAWISEGMTESISTKLERNKNLLVTGRTSVKQFKDSKESIPEIAKKLGVSYILEGSVRLQNNKALITAQLIDKNDVHVWAKEFNVVLDDILEIQSTIAELIVDELKINLSPKEKEQLEYKITDNTEAYKLYQKGRILADDRSKEGLEQSIEYYKRAFELDSKFAEALAEMANSYFSMGTYRLMDEQNSKKIALEYIEKAFALDSNSVRALTVKGLILRKEKKMNEAKVLFERAIKLNPNDATAHHYFALYYYNRNDESINNVELQLYHIRKAVQLEPFSVPMNGSYLIMLIVSKRFDEAEDHLNKVEHIFPKNRWADYRLMIYKDKADLLVKQAKDRTMAINYFKEELKNHLNYYGLYRLLAQSYDEVLNDDINFLENAKRAYELDSTRVFSAIIYCDALIENKMFKLAQGLMQSENYDKIVPEYLKKMNLLYYYYSKGEYDKCFEFFEGADNSLKILVYAQLGNLNKIIKIYRDNDVSHTDKAFVNAILKKRDSMYYYLNQEDIDFKIVNSRFEFDPYRKEERYKAFLKKHYLPITHWNE